MAEWILFFLPACLGQDPGLVVDVEDILKEHYPSLPAEDRIRQARRLAAGIALAPRERIETLVAGLPQLAGYCESVVSFHRGRLSETDANRGLSARGHEIFTDQMDLMVRRAAVRQESPELREGVERQITALATAGREALKDRLVGPAAAALVDREMDRLERGWKSSLDRPFNSVLDRPLSPAELDRVIQGLRIAALTVDRVEPSPSDLEDPKRLSALGVPQLLSKARESLTQAVALCYPERSEAVRREKAWIEEVGRVEAAEREAAQALSPKPSAPAPAGRNPGGKAGEPAPPAPIPPPPEGADRSPTAPPQLPDGSGVPWALGLALLAVLAVILAVWTSSRAR